MPFNRVTDIKATVMWLLVLNDRKDNSGQSQTPAKELNITLNDLPPYIPGLMLIPIKDAGFFYGHIDWAFWAVLGYVLGSIAYVVDSFYLWGLTYYDYSDDANNPQNYWNSMAAMLFVANALVCILDWWVQEKQLGLMNMCVSEDTTGGLKMEEIPIKQATYYFYNNLFFLGAAVVFMIQMMWMENINTDLLGCSNTFCGNFWMNFWGNMLYLFSSLFAILEYYANVEDRQNLNLPPLKLFSCTFREIDWFGWGDWLYFLISIASVFQSFLAQYIASDDSVVVPYYLGGIYLFLCDGETAVTALLILNLVNWLFLFDSVAYFIGYMLFVYDLREGLRTGIVAESNTAVFNAMIGDNVEGYEPPESPDRRLSNSSLPPTSHGPRFPSFSQPSRGSFGGRPSGAALFETLADPSDPSGQGSKISLAEIRKKLSQANQIRQRRSADFRYHGTQNHSAIGTTLSPIFEPTGVNHNSSSSTIGEAIELEEVIARVRSKSFDELNRLRARSHSDGFLNAL